jgi:tryptophan 5-monooxygenase
LDKNGDGGNDMQTCSSDKTSIIFTLKHQVGALARALQVFQELGINVLHIELHSEKETEIVINNFMNELL